MKPPDRTVRLSLVVLLALVASACSGPEDGVDEGLRGARIEVLAVWSGAEQQRFSRVLQAFERRTGVTVSYASAGHGVAAELDSRTTEGRLPDVAFLPQPGLLRRYGEEGALVPLDDATKREVNRNYAVVWRRLGSVGGQLYAVPFKAANKSLVWYDVAAFERAGVVPPDDLPGLVEVVGALVRAGVPAFSLGGADGWTLTDWFENLYLRITGPERYDLLAEHRIPWTDESVKSALRLMLELLRPDGVLGGLETALATRFEDSVERAFTRPAGAAMVVEGDFVASVVQTRTKAELAVDVDVFPFPTLGEARPMVVGGGDLAVLMRPSDAGNALMRYLASPDAAAQWVAAGGFISPNLNLDLSVYPDELSRGLARAVLDAGDDFRFDLSDLTPSAFGGREGQGMRKRLQDLVATRDVSATAVLLEADAVTAYSG